MPKFVRILVFAIIQLVFFPITIIGAILFDIVFLLSVRGKKLSLTAYDPFRTRWSLDVLGMREEPATRKIAFALPGMSRIPVWMRYGPRLLAMRLSGFYAGEYDYPLHQSGSIFGAIGHRTTFFDRTMQGYLDKVEQVVILGAGWDTRAYGIARHDGVRVFEVDTVQMQTAKRQALAKANVDTGDVVFATVDFNNESWLDALMRVDFDPTKPTYVLWEGVIYYLEPEAAAATLRTVATELAPGSAIAFDFYGQHFIDGDTSLFMRFGLWVLQALGEPLLWGINTDHPAEQQVAAYLEQHGLALAAFEPIGKADESHRADGGLVLAVNA